MEISGLERLLEGKTFINCFDRSISQQDCSCATRTEELQNELSELQTKLKELTEKVTQGCEKQQKLIGEVKQLQTGLESIASVVTDDSKLHLGNKNETAAATIKPVRNGSCIREHNGFGLGISSKSQTEKNDVSSQNKNNGPKETRHRSENRPDNIRHQSYKLQEPVGKPTYRNHKQAIGRSLFQKLEGIHSIICLDISESMCEENAWSQAQTFLTDYLKGLGEMSKLPDLRTEHVALVTFGHETKVQMRYTDRYHELQGLIDNFKLGGPSQMHGGVLCALSAAICSSHQIEKLRNGARVSTKIIMVTDGKPTESDLVAGPDIEDSGKIDETKAKILQEMENFRKNRMDVFFVPVGASDIIFLRTMVTCSEGMMLNFKSGRRVAKRQYLSTQLLDPLGMVTDDLTHGSGNDFSHEDNEDMKNIQERARNMRDSTYVTIVNGINDYNEIIKENLPPVGSRVRRGPDWTYNMQDSNGPGTLIGHSEDGTQVLVEWDTDNHTNIYRYSIKGYDVLVVDEPRVLAPGQEIAVGCEVEPGKDWNSSDQASYPGVVIHLNNRNKKAMVRWDDGKRGDYSYGDDWLQEIKVKSAFQKRGANGNGRSTDYTSGSVYNAGSQNSASSTTDDFRSSNFATTSSDDSRSLNSTPNIVDGPRIAKTIDTYTRRKNKNKNK